MSIVCMFPGQGSQSKGMGAGLFDRFADWTAEVDAILGYSIRELCLEDPRGELGQTRFTQPALFVVNAMTYRARQQDGRPAPDFVAGHSLGEYNALVAAGVLDFAIGVRLVRRRGEIMSQVSGGGMAAVIGLEPARIEAVLGQTEAGRRLDVANFNSFSTVSIIRKQYPRNESLETEERRDCVIAGSASTFLAAGKRCLRALKWAKAPSRSAKKEDKNCRPNDNLATWVHRAHRTLIHRFDCSNQGNGSCGCHVADSANDDGVDHEQDRNRPERTRRHRVTVGLRL